MNPATTSDTQESSSPESKCKLNKELLPIKFHYFYYFGALAPVYPFMPVIANARGFSSSILGVLYGVMPFVAAVAKPFAGALSDRFNAHKAFLVFFLFVETAFCFSFQWATPLPTRSPVAFTCNSTVFMEICPREGKFLRKFRQIDEDISCEVYCPEKKNVVFNSKTVIQSNLCFLIPVSVVKNHPCDENCDMRWCSYDFVRRSIETHLNVADAVHFAAFWLLLVFVVAVQIGQSIVTTISDTICVYTVREHPYKFGYQRLWGSLAYGFMSAIASLLVDESSDESEKNFQPLFIVSICLFVCAIVNTFSFKWQCEEKSKNIAQSLWRTLLDIHVVVFFSMTLIFGVFTQIVWVNILLYIEEIADTSVDFHEEKWLTTLQGLVILMECLAEVPFFFISDAIVTKIGHEFVYTAVMAVWAIRFLVYHLLTNPWFALPFELLNGVTFGLFYAAMVTRANALAPHGAEATVQGATSAIFEGVGLGIGGFLGGSLIGRWGHRTMFLALFIFALSASIVHGTFYFVLYWRKTKNKAITTDNQ